MLVHLGMLCLRSQHGYKFKQVGAAGAAAVHSGSSIGSACDSQTCFQRSLRQLQLWKSW